MKIEDFEKASLIDVRIRETVGDLCTLNRMLNFYICGEVGATNQYIYLSKEDQESVKVLLNNIFKKQLEEYNKKFEEIGKES